MHLINSRYLDINIIQFQFTKVLEKSTLYTKHLSSAFSPSLTTTLNLTSPAKQGGGLSTDMPGMQSCWPESAIPPSVAFLPIWKKSKQRFLWNICVRRSSRCPKIVFNNFVISSVFFETGFNCPGFRHWVAYLHVNKLVIELYKRFTFDRKGVLNNKNAFSMIYLKVIHYCSYSFLKFSKNFFQQIRITG